MSRPSAPHGESLKLALQATDERRGGGVRQKWESATGESDDPCHLLCDGIVCGPVGRQLPHGRQGRPDPQRSFSAEFPDAGPVPDQRPRPEADYRPPRLGRLQPDVRRRRDDALLRGASPRKLIVAFPSAKVAASVQRPGCALRLIATFVKRKATLV